MNYDQIRVMFGMIDKAFKKEEFFSEKTIFYLLLIFIALTPVPNANAIRNISLSLAGGISLFLFLRNNYRKSFSNPLLLPMFLFGAWALLGSILSPFDRIESFHAFVSHYLKYILLYSGVILFFSSKKRLETLLWSIVFSSTVYYAWTMLDYYVILGNPINKRLGNGYSGFVENIEGFVTITAILFALVLFKQNKAVVRRIFLLGSMFILSLASVLSQSRATIGALIIAILILAFKNKKFFFSTVLCIVLLLSFTSVPGRIGKKGLKDKNRKYIFNFSLEVVRDYAVVGTGFDINVFRELRLNHPEDYKRYVAKVGIPKKNFIYHWPHSNILSILVRTGLIGLLFYVSILFTFIKMSISGIRSSDQYWSNISWSLLAAFAAVFIKGLFEPTFVHKVDTIFYLILGLQSVIWIKGKNEFDEGN